jgi:hypothetical protein
MSRKQWGHGYHTGRREAEKRQEPTDFGQDTDTLGGFCRQYLKGELDRDAFEGCVLSVTGSWDPVATLMLHSRVEATVGEHFCGFWTDCDDGHDPSVPDSRSEGWVPIGRPKAGTAPEPQ